MRRLVGWQERIRQHVKRPIRLPHALAGLGVLVVVVVLAADSLAPRSGPGPSPIGGSASPTSVATPGAPEADWSALQLPAYEQLADLAPVDADASGVALESAFVLRSRTSTAATELAAGLHIEPAFAFKVAPGATTAEARIVPSEPLSPGVRYRFSLDDPTGRLIGTWSYRTGHPLEVVGRTPDDRATDVPTDTGIEITFDQDGATDVAAHFSIVPAVAGSFQTVGRTVVFAPTAPLAASSVYRVTLTPGIGIAGSDQVLETGVTWSFETRGPEVHEAYQVSFGLPMFETTLTEPAVIAVDLSYDDGADPGTIPLQAYRLPSFAAAREATTTILADPGWPQLDSSDLVATTGLTRVLDADVVPALRSPDGLAVLRLPAPLAAGWYLLDIPRAGRDRQAVLQVTNLAAWAMTSTTRTLAWVHDLASGAPVAGAGFFDPAGNRVGTTGESGLVDVPTPSSLLARADSDYRTPPTLATVVAPDGARLIVALGAQSQLPAYAPLRDAAAGDESPSDRWWLLLSTDRSTYRPSDTIHAWGVVRARDDGSVPGSIEIRLRTADSPEQEGPWLETTTASLTPRGVWAVDLAVRDLPYGDYVVDLVVAGRVAQSTWIGVRDIRKPAYQVEVVTDRAAVIAGDPVQVSAATRFFDGTAAAGLDLLVTAFGGSSTVTTSAAGATSFTVKAATESTGGYDYGNIGLRPADPEEGQIAGGVGVVVFPSGAWIAASASIEGSTAHLTGKVSHVDLASVERQLRTDGNFDDPAGAAYGGRTITIAVAENVPVTRQTGTTYDFIEKRVVPVFETTYHDVAVGIYTTTSAADGTFGLSVAVPHPENGYTLKMTTRDGQGRGVTESTYASKRSPDEAQDAGTVRPAYLEQPTACGRTQKSVAVDDEVELTMHDGDGTVSGTGPYLFVVAARGIRDAVLQDSPTFRRTFARADLPDVEITAIRFRPAGYVITNEVLVTATPESRHLTVTIRGDRSNYAPGDTATVTITTTGADGSPVPADVVIRGVDEKLFASGGAADVDALGVLLQPVGDGLLQSGLTHQLPIPGLGDGCGDATGGRDDFRDSIVFQRISTNAAGMASTSFRLPDDITSWHISATAIDARLEAGDAATLLPVGLPFFADVILAPEFLVGEQPVLRVRSAGTALPSDAKVRYTVSSASLLMPATTVEATGPTDASIQLPAVPRGSQQIIVDAVVVGHPGLRDRLTRTFIVRDTRVGLRSSLLVDPTAAASAGGTDLTTYVVSDAGRGSLLPMTSELVNGGGARFDRALAAELARSFLISEFGVEASSLPPESFDVTRWQRDGVALLPYSSADLELTALAALVAPERLDRQRAGAALDQWLAEQDPSRERQIVALTGQAALGGDVVDTLATFDRSKLSVSESLWLALGYLTSGDETTARSIERSLLDTYGESLGAWVRLRIGSTLADSVEATALMTLVAAGLGDPLATQMLAYLRDNRVPTFLPVLHEIGAIRWLLDRLPRAAATFTWTVDGRRHVETLDPGQSRTIVVTDAQRQGLKIEPGVGSISVLASWTSAPSAGNLPSSELVSIERTVTPDTAAGRTDIVRVTLNVIFAPQAPLGCYDVTDSTPSGLAPLVSVLGWPESEDGEPRTGIRPWAVDGQRVSWCVDPADGRRPVLTYSARVVSPGTFTWEPAIAQAAAAPSIGASTPIIGYAIR